MSHFLSSCSRKAPLAIKKPRSPYGMCAASYLIYSVFSSIGPSLLRRWQIRTAAMRHFGSHANRFSERRMRVNGFTDV